MIATNSYTLNCSISPLISVVICTYNRAELLREALETLCQQTFDSSCYEVLVVDNNSQDNTRAVAEEYGRHYPHVRYSFELQQGLSHARNHGWRAANGEYIAYIDDDCIVPEQWLGVAEDIIKRLSPAAFGGPFYPFYKTPKPRWYKDSYGSHKSGDAARILKQSECVEIYGGNAFFCRSVLQTLGGFDYRLGMSGDKIAYGEETALLQLLSATMPDQTLYYDPRLYVYHLVRFEKMSLRWVIRDTFVHASYAHRLFHDQKPLPKRIQLLRQTVNTFLGLGLDIIRGILKRDRQQYPYIQNYLYEHTGKYVSKLGRLYQQHREHRNRSTICYHS